MADGAALTQLAKEISNTITAASEIASLGQYCVDLGAALQTVQVTLESISKESNPSLALANATIFLDAMGHVVIAWMWLKQAVAANTGLKNTNEQDIAFYQGKLAACQFFYRYELPKAMNQFDLVAKVDDTCFNLTPEQFIGV